MQVDVMYRPAASIAKLTLAQGETVTAEVGAMLAMTPRITVETTSRSRGGGMLKGLKRMFSGESYFLNHFTSHAPDQVLLVAPTMVGDIIHHRLAGGTLVVQGSSWLASSPGIEIDTTWQGFSKALFSGESAFWVKCSGMGDVLLNSFGAIYEVYVNGDYIVDTGHIVAFEETLAFDLTKAGKSWIGSFLGGEGVVCKFRGQGRLWCQSHNPPSFGQALGSMLKPR